MTPEEIQRERRIVLINYLCVVLAIICVSIFWRGCAGQ